MNYALGHAIFFEKTDIKATATKKIAMIYVFYLNHPNGTTKGQHKTNRKFNKTFLFNHSTPITPPLTAHKKKRHLTRIRRNKSTNHISFFPPLLDGLLSGCGPGRRSLFWCQVKFGFIGQGVLGCTSGINQTGKDVQ